MLLSKTTAGTFELVGTIILVDEAGEKTVEKLVLLLVEKRVLLAEITGEPDGIVGCLELAGNTTLLMFVEGAGEDDGTMTALEITSNYKEKRVLLANGKGKPETTILSLDVASGKAVEKLVPLANSVGEPEGMIVPLWIASDSDAKKLVMYVDRVGEAEGTITTLEVTGPELADKKTVEKLLPVPFGVRSSIKVLAVSGTSVLIDTVVMPAVTLRLYLVFVSSALQTNLLANLREIYRNGFLLLLSFQEPRSFLARDTSIPKH